MKRINCAYCCIINSHGLIKWEQTNQALRWLNEEICKGETYPSLPPIKHLSKYHRQRFKVNPSAYICLPQLYPVLTALSCPPNNCPCQPALLKSHPPPFLFPNFSFSHSLSSLQREKIERASHVKRFPNGFPLGAAACGCQFEAKTESRPTIWGATELLQREPRPRTQHSPYPSSSPYLRPSP